MQTGKQGISNLFVLINSPDPRAVRGDHQVHSVFICGVTSGLYAACGHLVIQRESSCLSVELHALHFYVNT